MTNDELMDKYPSLFRLRDNRAEFAGCSIPPGWMFIVEKLCSDLDWPRFDLKATIDHRESEGAPQLNWGATLEENKKEFDDTEWPAIVQIKEKFGGLRFYTENATDKQSAVIGFVEVLAESLCQKCGAPATLTTDKNTWARRGLCDDCNELKQHTHGEVE